MDLPPPQLRHRIWYGDLFPTRDSDPPPYGRHIPPPPPTPPLPGPPNILHPHPPSVQALHEGRYPLSLRFNFSPPRPLAGGSHVYDPRGYGGFYQGFHPIRFPPGGFVNRYPSLMDFDDRRGVLVGDWRSDLSSHRHIDEMRFRRVYGFSSDLRDKRGYIHESDYDDRRRVFSNDHNLDLFTERRSDENRCKRSRLLGPEFYDKRGFGERTWENSRNGQVLQLLDMGPVGVHDRCGPSYHERGYADMLYGGMSDRGQEIYVDKHWNNGTLATINVHNHERRMQMDYTDRRLNRGLNDHHHRLHRDMEVSDAKRDHGRKPKGFVKGDLGCDRDPELHVRSRKRRRSKNIDPPTFSYHRKDCSNELAGDTLREKEKEEYVWIETERTHKKESEHGFVDSRKVCSNDLEGETLRQNEKEGYVRMETEGIDKKESEHGCVNSKISFKLNGPVAKSNLYPPCPSLKIYFDLKNGNKETVCDMAALSSPKTGQELVKPALTHAVVLQSDFLDAYSNHLDKTAMRGSAVNSRNNPDLCENINDDLISTNPRKKRRLEDHFSAEKNVSSENYHIISFNSSEGIDDQSAAEAFNLKGQRSFRGLQFASLNGAFADSHGLAEGRLNAAEDAAAPSKIGVDEVGCPVQVEYSADKDTDHSAVLGDDQKAGSCSEITQSEGVGNDGGDMDTDSSNSELTPLRKFSLGGSAEIIVSVDDHESPGLTEPENEASLDKSFPSDGEPMPVDSGEVSLVMSHDEVEKAAKKVNLSSGKISFYDKNWTLAGPKFLPHHYSLKYSSYPSRCHSAHCMKSRTWHRTSNSSDAIVEPKVKPLPVSKVQSVTANTLSTYMRKGNSLVRKPLPLGDTPSAIHGPVSKLISCSNKDTQPSDCKIYGSDASALSSGYFKSKKNQIVRKVSDAKKSGTAKAIRYSSFSFVWKLHNKQPPNKHKRVAATQKMLPQLLPWKRNTYLRSCIRNLHMKETGGNFPTTSKKSPVSRKKGAIYVRSSNGYSLKMSRVQSISRPGLKWPNQIERNSGNASEVDACAITAVKEHKEDRKAAMASMSRNFVHRERIYLIGSERYKMNPARRTLQRIIDESASSNILPQKTFKVSLVPKLLLGSEKYVRIGKGNQLVRDPKKRTRVLASEKIRWSLHTARLRLARRRKFCQFFTRYGKCNKHDGKCPYIHDPSKIVVCTKFLSGSCSNPDCKLTHKVIPERMQDCSYFLKGSCSNDNCPYRHVHVNPSSSVCESFLRGYCADGNECPKKHTYVCPSFEATGTCPQASTCKLHHPKKKAERTTPGDENVVRGRYFDGGLIDASGDSCFVALEKVSSTGKVDFACPDGKFPDYISLDVSHDEEDQTSPPATSR